MRDHLPSRVRVTTFSLLHSTACHLFPPEIHQAYSRPKVFKVPVSFARDAPPAGISFLSLSHSFSPQLKCHCLKSLPWPLYLKQPTHRFPFLCPALVSITALNHSLTLYHVCYRSPPTLSVLSCLSLETLSILFTAMHIIEHIKCTY